MGNQQLLRNQLQLKSRLPLKNQQQKKNQLPLKNQQQLKSQQPQKNQRPQKNQQPKKNQQPLKNQQQQSHRVLMHKHKMIYDAVGIHHNAIFNASVHTEGLMATSYSPPLHFIGVKQQSSKSHVGRISR